METPKSNAAHRDNERGASMLEFAVLAPVLIAMLLGITTLGVGYNRLNSLNNGARESARYAATLPVADDLTAWLNAVADVAGSAADMDTSAAGQKICVAYVFPEGSDTHDKTLAIIDMDGSRTFATDVTCFDDGRPPGERRVQITVERSTSIQTGFYSKNVTLDARSVARFERA